jgi:hypothetical protein
LAVKHSVESSMNRTPWAWVEEGEVMGGPTRLGGCNRRPRR